ncbi:MAG: D-alanyl-D-alanine carboxypeptidase family protein [Xanthobacteraceae bacterium]
MHCTRFFRAQAFIIALGSFFCCSLVAAVPARASSSILIEADTGKVLRAENATYPWYPASTTKLMTLYMTLSAIRDQRISFDTLFTVSPYASSQAPTKMGFPVGTQVTVDNALKMMMVKSANDMAVLLAEGIGGSVDDFAVAMTDTAHRIGMTESSFVNPNGLPADGQIMSARDLAILARALIREFPEYSSYWHIPAIKWGRRVVRNYNPLLGRYPGADGMKTGFICASGFNLVATATRDNKQLIAVVLGAPSSSARALKAAELLENGFNQKPLSWLTPSLGIVNALAPIEASPPDLKDEMCGRHRKRPATETDDPDATIDNGDDADANPQVSVLLSALRAPTPKNLLPDPGPVIPVVVYTGPTRSPAQIATLAAVPEAADPVKKKSKHKTAAAAGGKKTASVAADAKSTDAKSTEAKSTEAKSSEAKSSEAAPADGKKIATTPADGKKAAAPADKKKAAAKPAAAKPKDAKASGKTTEIETPDSQAKTAAAKTVAAKTAAVSPWTPMSASALATSPPPELKADTPATAPLPKKRSTANFPL